MLTFLSVQTLSSLSLFLVASFIWTSIWNFEWSYCWLFIIGCWTGKTRKQLTPWPSDKAGLYFSFVWMIITNFPYVSVLPWKILPSHRLKNLTIVLVETSLALGTTSCINTTRTNSTTVYTIWGIYGTSEKVRRLPTFFCCHCFFDVPSKMPVVLLMIMNIFREEKKVVLNADLRCKCFDLLHVWVLRHSRLL